MSTFRCAICCGVQCLRLVVRGAPFTDPADGVLCIIIYSIHKWMPSFDVVSFPARSQSKRQGARTTFSNDRPPHSSSFSHGRTEGRTVRPAWYRSLAMAASNHPAASPRLKTKSRFNQSLAAREFPSWSCPAYTNVQ